VAGDAEGRTVVVTGAAEGDTGRMVVGRGDGELQHGAGEGVSLTYDVFFSGDVDVGSSERSRYGADETVE
jgi:hypothetical protein